jgi:hypothetical protein
MTGEAWVMLILTWSVIIYFTGKFFRKVLNTPPKKEEE